MKNLTLDKTDIRIASLVNKWDLSEEKKQSKIKILKSWQLKINNEEKFETILKICDYFRYYSPSLTEDTYKKFWEETKKEYGDFEGFLKTTLFTPLRSRERIESSIDMFSQFRLANSIDANSTFIEGPIVFVRKFKERKNDLKEKITFTKSEEKTLTQQIDILKNSLQTSILDKKTNKKIQKKINTLERKIHALKEQEKSSLNEFKKKFYYVKNIVIVDDFIGTGNSGEKLVKRLANELKESGITITFHLWVLEASDKGKMLIENAAQSLGIDLKIKFGLISHNVLAENLIFMTSDIPRVRDEINELMKDFKIPRSRYSNNHALASFVNAPNNNLALLSNESDRWEALFLRTKRVEEEKIIEDNDELKDIMQFIMGGE